jgi:hypothetical protein
MHKSALKKKVLAVMFLPLLLVSCNRQEEKTEVPPKNVVEQEEAVHPASLLSLVPDDTIFFLGGLEPMPLQESLQWNSKHFQMPDSLDPQEMLEPVKNMTESAGQRMALQLWTDYYQTVMLQKEALASWGIADSPLIAAYAVGLLPVLRISLQDVSQFQKKIEEIESKAQVKAEPETVGSAVFKRYPLLDGEQKISLIIGTDKQQAVFLVDLGIDSEQVLSLVALGQSKPEKSLAESRRLESLRAEYNLDPAWMGYVDHQQIVTGLTTKDGNRMAKMVQKLAAHPLSGTRNLSPSCKQKAVTMISKLWLQTGRAWSLATPRSISRARLPGWMSLLCWRARTKLSWTDCARCAVLYLIIRTIRRHFPLPSV